MLPVDHATPRTHAVAHCTWVVTKGAKASANNGMQHSHNRPSGACRSNKLSTVMQLNHRSHLHRMLLCKGKAKGHIECDAWGGKVAYNKQPSVPLDIGESHLGGGGGVCPRRARRATFV